MIEYAVDTVDDYVAPPTREMIEEVRNRQLEALKALRRKLLLVRRDDRSVA